MNNILIEFDMVIDTDYGLIKMIKDKYNNPEYIDKKYLDLVENNVLIYSLVKRDIKNPLSLIINDKYKDSINKLLNEFYDNEYKNILEYSHKTNIYDLINIYLMTNQISINILCKNVLEEQFISNMDINITPITENDYSKINIDKYDCIFIKDFNNILKFKDVKVKNIYIARYSFNLEKDNQTPLKEISDEIKEGNLFFIIDIYDTNLNALG